MYIIWVDVKVSCILACIKFQHLLTLHGHDNIEIGYDYAQARLPRDFFTQIQYKVTVCDYT